MKTWNDVFNDRVLTIPNLISAFRILLVPFFVYYVREYVYYNFRILEYVIIVNICIVVVISDFLDGYFARLLNQESIFGIYLDPVSDKIVTITGLGVAVYYFSFPIWIFILYIIREIIGFAVGTFLFFRRGFQGRPNIWGKTGVALVAVSVYWYISSPLIIRYFPENNILRQNQYSAYILITVVAIGSYVYLKTYWEDFKGGIVRTTF